MLMLLELLYFFAVALYLKAPSMLDEKCHKIELSMPNNYFFISSIGFRKCEIRFYGVTCFVDLNNNRTIFLHHMVLYNSSK